MGRRVGALILLLVLGSFPVVWSGLAIHFDNQLGTTTTTTTKDEDDLEPEVCQNKLALMGFTRMGAVKEILVLCPQGLSPFVGAYSLDIYRSPRGFW